MDESATAVPETAAGPALDPALDPGAALPPPEALDPLAQALAMLQAGGPVVAILLLLSVVALAIVLLKLWQFAWLGVGVDRRARAALALYRSGRGEEALGHLSGLRNPGARLLALAIRGRLREDLPEPQLREELARLGAEQVELLRGWLRPLEVIGGLAPLLGLFGTVLGMIAAFQALERAGSRVDPAILSGGIWEALLTTAVGLAVAIPAVALLNWLERRVERQAQEMESLVTQVFTRDLAALPSLRLQRENWERERERGPRLHAAGD